MNVQTMLKLKLKMLGGGDKFSLPYAHNFSDGLGDFSGANLSLVGGKLVITPTYGASLWDADAAVFTSGTYAWTKYGNNTIANVNNALEVTYVDNVNGAYDQLRDISDLSSNLTVGTWYRMGFKAKINTGSFNPQVWDSTGHIDLVGINAANLTSYNINFKSGSTAGGQFILNGLGAGEVATIDDLSLCPFSFPSFFAPFGQEADPTNIIVKAAWTATAGHPCGVAACLDSYADPKYGIIAIIEPSLGKAYLYKLVNGAYTTLIFDAGITYAAGANIEIRKHGTAVELYYNGSQVGDTQTVTDVGVINNKKHTLFSTDPTNTASSFSLAVYPAVTGGVAIMFDDVADGPYTDGFQYMVTAGVKGTLYMISDRIGTAGYLTAEQLQTLAATNLIVIGNHTKDHTLLTGLTQAQQQAEFTGCKSALDALGLTVASSHVAYPNGAYNANTLLAMAATGMLTGRGTATGDIVPKLEPAYELRCRNIVKTTTLATVQGWITQAVAMGENVAILLHTLGADPASMTVANFQALIDWIVAQGIPTKTIVDIYNERQ